MTPPHLSEQDRAALDRLLALPVTRPLFLEEVEQLREAIHAFVARVQEDTDLLDRIAGTATEKEITICRNEEGLVQVTVCKSKWSWHTAKAPTLREALRLGVHPDVVLAARSAAPPGEGGDSDA